MNEKIKNHLKRRRIVYTSICTGVVVAGITVLIMREPRTILQGGVDCPVKEPTGSLSFLFGRSIFGHVSNTNNAVTTIHNGLKGHPGFVTRCVETGELFTTQGSASKAFNIPESIMSKHLNQGRELIEGLHFERLGVFGEVA